MTSTRRGDSAKLGADMASGRPHRDLLLLAVASLLVQLPFLERGISFYDEGSILAIADALRQGERLYADRVTPVAPLIYELLAALFAWLGPGLAVGRVLQAVVLSGCVLLGYTILAPVAGRRPALLGALAILGVKPLGFPLWTIVNYSQVALLWCLLVLWSVMRFLGTRRLAWLLGAGLGAGLTLVTKQNLGAMIGALAGIVLVVDWLREDARRVVELVRRGAVLGAGAALVVAVTLAAYVARGTLGALVDRAVLGPLYLTEPYFVPLPGAELWALRPFELAPRVFAHFPSPLFDLLADGRIDGSNPLLFLPLELAVKAFYYAPVALFAVAAVGLARTFQRREARAAWSQRLALLLFAVASWASMLYRADWTHLLNVYPAFLLLAALLWPSGPAAPRAARRTALAGAALWVAASAVLGAVVLETYDTPLETPRGRVLARPAEIAEVRSVLAFLGERPPGETLLVLRSDPLYYFLAGRRIPAPFDLVVPGYLTPEDDARLAESLGAVDRVLYDPSRIPTMTTPITEYAPRTSEALAGGFRVERLVTPNEFLLARHDAVSIPEEVAVDLWEHAADLAGAPRAESWLAYRVLALDLPADGAPACFSMTHEARPGEIVTALPMLSPDLWVWARGRPSVVRARFEIRARAPGEPESVIWSDDLVAAPPPAKAHASLDAFAGRRLELAFCARIARGPGLSTPGAWGSLRIVREVGGS